MARDFEASSTEFLEIGSRLVGDEPISMAVWGKPESVGTFAWIMAEGNTAAVDDIQGISLDSGGTISAITQANGESLQFVSSTGTVSNGVWFHALAVFPSVSSHIIYLDGVKDGPDSSDRNPTINVTTVGGLNENGSHASSFDGLLAEAAIWNVGLSDDDALVLAAGYSPAFVRPDALAAYWQLIGRNSPETDLFGGNDLTVTGTVVADHPRIIYPSVAQVWSVIPAPTVVPAVDEGMFTGGLQPLAGGFD